MSSSDLRRSMTATYDEADYRRPRRRAPLRRQPRGPAHHAFKEEVREKPAWVFPVLIAAAVVTASAIVLYMMIGPKDLTGSRPEGTASTAPVDVMIGGMPLRIPANYTQFPKDREGGEMGSISLYVLLPQFKPYTNDKRDLFFSNAPNSRVLFFELRGSAPAIREAERPEAIYMPQIADGSGTKGPGGLTQYQFNEDSPYAGEDLFIGKVRDGDKVVFLCDRRSGMVPSPNCWRETVLPNGLAIRYRFKRHYLKYWEGIDSNLRTLVERFRTAGAGGPLAAAE